MTDAVRTILERRARALARPVAADEEADFEALDLLLIQVDGERLAIPLDSIVAIARPGSITPLPRAVAPVYGVTAWHGRPLTVLSLGSDRPAIDHESRLVVLGTGARAMLAIVVEAVDDVMRVPAASLTPAQAGPRRAYALGVMADGLLVVSGDALLHPERLAR